MPEHAIPQDILQYEFKLFAGLSWREFLYVGIGLGGGYIVLSATFKGILPLWFGIPLGFLLLVGGPAFGLVKIQNRSMENWIGDLIRIYTTPLIRIWQKESVGVKVKDWKQAKPKQFPAYMMLYFETKKIETKRLSQANVGAILQQRQQQLGVMAPLEINTENYSIYADNSISLPEIPNTFAIVLFDATNKKPIEGAIAAIAPLDSKKPLYILKSNKLGQIYFAQSLADGQYVIVIEHPEYKFPIIKVKKKKSIFKHPIKILAQKKQNASGPKQS